MNAADAVRRLTELRLIEVGSQLSVIPTAAAVCSECWQVLADLAQGCDCLPHARGVLLAAEELLSGSVAA